MLLNLAEVTGRVQVLLDDAVGTWADKDYLRPFINQAWDELATRLTALGLTYEEIVAVLTPVAAGTLNLDTFAAAGGLLEFLLVPTFAEWRLVADLDIAYREVPFVAMLPDVVAETIGHVAAEWRAGHVYITPSAVDTTIRLRGKAISTNLVDPNDQVIHGVTHILAYKTVEIVCSPTVRNNAPGAQWAASKGLAALEDFEVVCTKQRQRLGFRIQRMSGRNRLSRRSHFLR